MKYFFITIDTEGDNLWRWDRKSGIGTQNVKYLPRFQSLCEDFGFKPVWLTNFEMIEDPIYVDFVSKVEEKGTGEIGMHLHAWNTPPLYELPHLQRGLPYLIEYPDDVMREKIATMTSLIKERTGISPTSHRAGRWAMDDRYFSLLKGFGYTVDCSVTPHKNWNMAPGQTGINGTDYTLYPESAYWIDPEHSLLEVPVTVRNTNRFFLPNRITLKNIARSGYQMIKGGQIWLRPNGNNLNQLKYLIETIADSDAEYIMFMLHSSEFMPGGSPTFPDKKSIESLYNDMREIFKIASNHFTGLTLREYYRQKQVQ